MADRNPASNLTTHRLLLMTAIVGGVGLLIALAARLRNGLSSTAVPPAPVRPLSEAETYIPLASSSLAVTESQWEHEVPYPEGEPGDEIAQADTRLETVSRKRETIFAGLIVSAFVALVFLPHNISSTLFGVLIVASIVVGVRTSGVTIHDAWRVAVRAKGALRSLASFTLGKYRTAMSAAFASAALGCMLLATLRYYMDWLNNKPPSEGLRWTIAGAVAVGVALYLRRPPFPALAAAQDTQDAAPPVRWRSVVAGAFGLWLLAEINGNLLHILPVIHYTAQTILLFASVLLVVRGLGRGLRLPRLERREFWLLLACTLLAVILRVMALDFTIHRFVDEIHYVNAITRLWATPDTRILIPFSDVTAFTWIYPWLQSGAVSLVGANLTGLRLVSALFGALTIPALYFLGRLLFDRKLALLAALILATFPAHLHFSRLALNNIADPFFGTLALGFLARGLKSGRRSDFVLSGAALGLTQYFYEGGRLLYPPLVALWFVVCLVVGRRRGISMRGPLAGLLAAVLIAVPVYYTLYGQQSALTPRLNHEGLLLNVGWMTPGERFETLAYPFLVYVSIPDFSWFYGGDNPIIWRYMVPLFLLGVVFMLWRIRSPGAQLLLLWVLFTSLGNVLMRDRAWTPRYVVAFPALALLLAAGLRYTWDLIWPEAFQSIKRRRALVAAALALAAAQTIFYFGQQVPQFNHLAGRIQDPEDAIFRSIDFPPSTHVHIIHIGAVWPINIETLRTFWNMDVGIEARLPDQITYAYVQYLAEIQRDGDHAFFVDPNDADTIRKLRAYFYLLPAQFSPYNIPFDQQLALFYAPRNYQFMKNSR